MTKGYIESMHERMKAYTAKHRLVEDVEEVAQTKQVPEETIVSHEGEVVPAAPQDENVGMADVLNSLVIDEWEAISGYNSAIATAREYGFDKLVTTLTEIANEENIHVGQLEALLQTVSKQTASIADGREEGNEQLTSEGV